MTNLSTAHMVEVVTIAHDRRQGFVVIEVHEDLIWNMAGINLPSISFFIVACYCTVD